jgi:mannose-6-phosphate isomerase-like protein (cupin superfamily)
MKPSIIKAQDLKETLTPERCYIVENYRSNDQKVTIAQARVKAGVTTAPHHLIGTEEIYIIAKGTGKVHLNKQPPTIVKAGDVVVIPAGNSQSITNIGKTDLVFHCVCTPAFTQDCYVNEEKAAKP